MEALNGRRHHTKQAERKLALLRRRHYSGGLGMFAPNPGSPGLEHAMPDPRQVQMAYVVLVQSERYPSETPQSSWKTKSKIQVCVGTENGTSVR